jgi:hypothetical protein
MVCQINFDAKDKFLKQIFDVSHKILPKNKLNFLFLSKEVRIIKYDLLHVFDS